DDRHMAEVLAARDVGDVHLDEWGGAHLDRVHHGDGVVGERSGVEDDRELVVTGLVEPLDELALVVGLPDFHVKPEFFAGPLAQVRQIGIRGGSVYRGLTLPEAAEVRAVEHEDPGHLATAWYASVSRSSGGLS